MVMVFVVSCCLSIVEKKEKKPPKPRELLPFEGMEVCLISHPNTFEVLCNLV